MSFTWNFLSLVFEPAHFNVKETMCTMNVYVKLKLGLMENDVLPWESWHGSR